MLIVLQPLSILPQQSLWKAFPSICVVDVKFCCLELEHSRRRERESSAGVEAGLVEKLAVFLIDVPRDDLVWTLSLVRQVNYGGKGFYNHK